MYDILLFDKKKCISHYGNTILFNTPKKSLQFIRGSLIIVHWLNAYSYHMFLKVHIAPEHKLSTIPIPYNPLIPKQFLISKKRYFYHQDSNPHERKKSIIRARRTIVKQTNKQTNIPRHTWKTVIEKQYNPRYPSPHPPKRESHATLSAIPNRPADVTDVDRTTSLVE